MCINLRKKYGNKMMLNVEKLKAKLDKKLGEKG